MLSNKAKYAIRALLHLAKRNGNGQVLIADIAKQERIPRKFLEVILVELKNAGLLRSKSGKNGGYALHRPAEEITLGQVIRLIDGSVAPVPCVSHSAYVPCKDCLSEQKCVIRSVMKRVRDAMAKILDETTLDAMARQDLILNVPGNSADFDI